MSTRYDDRLLCQDKRCQWALVSIEAAIDQLSHVDDVLASAAVDLRNLVDTHRNELAKRNKMIAERHRTK